MRNLFLCLAVVFLSSCIPVEDFGIYWKKGAIDPALLGTWVEVTPSARNVDDRKAARTVTVPEQKQAMQVSNKNGTYQIDSLDPEERQKKGYVPASARTLVVDGYTFLMVIDREGGDRVVKGLLRYKLEGDVFREYSLADGPMGAFLRANFPYAKNIKEPSCKDKKSNCPYAFVRIGTLDGETLKILAQVPDTKEFWKATGIYRRQNGAAGN